MNHFDVIVLGILMLVLGAMVTGFFTLLWRRIDEMERNVSRRFDSIDSRFEKLEAITQLIQKDQTQFYGITQKLEGRVDEISHRVK